MKKYIPLRYLFCDVGQMHPSKGEEEGPSSMSSEVGIPSVLEIKERSLKRLVVSQLKANPQETTTKEPSQNRYICRLKKMDPCNSRRPCVGVAV